MLNIERIRELINTKYNGNASAFAKEIGVTASGVSRILKGNRRGGMVIMQKLIHYLKANDMDVSEYIFL